MRKPDEIALARYVLDNFVEFGGELTLPESWPVDWAEEWARENGVPVKRVYYIINKWDDNEIWNFGVSLRTGWVERPDELREIAAEQPA